jgi:hypothetical protein
MPSRHQLPARTRLGWLVAASVTLAVSAGCGAEDRPAREPAKHTAPTAPANAPAAVYCQHHIDELIAAHIVPRADRDYAMGMCGTQQQRK